MEDFLNSLERHFTIALLDKKAQDVGKVLASEKSLQILEALSENHDTAGMTASELSERLGIARTTVIYHLGRLQEHGLVELNPLLTQWDDFWEDYRKGRSGISKEEFNRIHGAKMKGEKLYMPTRRGVLFLPTGDPQAGEAMVREAIIAVTTPQAAAYRDTIKRASAVGILGIFLLAVSFLYTPALPVAPMEAAPMMAAAGEFEPAEKAMPLEEPTEEAVEKAPLVVVGCGGGDYPAAADAAEGRAEETEEKKEVRPPETTAPAPREETVLAQSEGPERADYIRPALKYAGVFLIGIAFALGLGAYRSRETLAHG